MTGKRFLASQTAELNFNTNCWACQWRCRPPWTPCTLCCRRTQTAAKGSGPSWWSCPGSCCRRRNQSGSCIRADRPGPPASQTCSRGLPPSGTGLGNPSGWSFLPGLEIKCAYKDQCGHGVRERKYYPTFSVQFIY